MFPKPINTFSPKYQLIYKIVLPIVLIIWLLPLIAIFLTSVRSAADINTGNVFGWPSQFLLIENYSEIFKRSKAILYLKNSFLITIPTVILSVSLACLAGYALAIYRFRWSLPLFFIFVAGNFIPFQILMIPVRDMSVSTGLYNTISGQVLFHAAFQTGFCTFFMRNFIKALPSELFEAARIDGASNSQMFWYITLPGVSRIFLLVSVLQIIAHLQIFAQSQLLTGGGPNNNSRTLVQLIYEYSFRDMRMGSGAAVSVVLFLIIGFFTFLQFRLFRENE